MQQPLHYILILCMSVFSISQSIHAKTIGFSIVEEIEGVTFEDINEQLIEIIEGRGIVISYTSHAQKMLLRTSPQINPDYNVYTNALIHLFCTAEQAHEMTSINPHIISGCPYGIAVYELANNPGNVFLSYRKTSVIEYQKVMAMLQDIVNEVTEEFGSDEN